MKFGICTSVDDAPEAKAAGWDFVEESVQNFLQGMVSDAQWTGLARAKKSPLPILAANVLVPGTLKITGPTANLDQLRQYMTRVIARASVVGVQKLVFGSGAARNVPDGFDPEEARRQIEAFCTMSAQLAQDSGIILVVEHLRHEECNIINTVQEAMRYVHAVNSPALCCLVDSFHLWSENESLDSVKQAMPRMRHVHVADLQGRVGPGLSGKSDYRPLFRLLRNGGYDQWISVEAPGFDVSADGARVLAFLRDQWENA